MKETNQQPWKKRDNRVRKVYKLYFKQRDCTIALFRGMTLFSALRRKKIFENMYKGWNGKFIVGV